MAKQSTKKDDGAKAGRKPQYPPGATPSKSEAKNIAKEYMTSGPDGGAPSRASKTGCARYCVEKHDLSNEGVALVVNRAFKDADDIDEKEGGTLRRAALRALAKAKGGDDPKPKAKVKTGSKKAKTSGSTSAKDGGSKKAKKGKKAKKSKPPKPEPVGKNAKKKKKKKKGKK